MYKMVAQMVKNLPAMQETEVQSLGRDDLLEKEMHSSILAWRSPWREECGRLSPRGHKEWNTTKQLIHCIQIVVICNSLKKELPLKKCLIDQRMFTFLKPFVPITDDAVFPLLPAVDLIGSSLIQHVLRHQSLWEAEESTLSVQQLFQALQEMFQKVRVEKPGQMHPRASELTLSLLTAMYDR